MLNFPILEIDGIRMHLISFKGPYDYGKLIAKKLKINEDDVVLETAFGLGYVTYSLLKARKVIAFEKSKEVLMLAEDNPFSLPVLKSKKLILVNEDITKASFEPQFGKSRMESNRI